MAELVGGDADEHGNPAVRTIEVLLDEDSERWQVIARLPNARRGFSACACGTKIYFLAGDSRNTDELDTNNSLSSWDAFDVVTRYGEPIHCMGFALPELRRWDSETLSLEERTMPLIDNWGQAVTMPEHPLRWKI